MDTNYYEAYATILGEKKLPLYTSPEECANKIKKCTLLKDVSVSYSNTIEEYNNCTN